MPFRLLLTLAWRNLMRNVRRSMFGLVTIASGVIGLSLTGGFVQDVFEQLGEATISAQLGHLQVTRAGFHEGGAGTPEKFLVSEPDRITSLLRADPRIADTMGRLSFSALLGTGAKEVSVEVEGVEPAPEARLGTRLQMLEGRQLDDGDSAGILLGEGVARQLRVGIGGSVNLTAATLDGALNSIDLEVVGVFRSFSKDFDDRAARVVLPVAQELVQAGSVNTIVVRLHRTTETAAALAAASDRLAASGLVVEPWYELSDFYANTEAMYAKQFGFLKLIAIVLVVMSVVNSLNMTVFERTAEFGTMRVLGNRAGDVVRLIVLEAGLLGVAGAALGAAVSVVAAAGISHVGIPMPPPPNMEAGYTARILLTLPGVLEAAMLGIVSATVAAVIPALRFVRLPLVEALRRAV